MYYSRTYCVVSKWFFFFLSVIDFFYALWSENTFYSALVYGPFWTFSGPGYGQNFQEHSGRAAVLQQLGGVFQKGLWDPWADGAGYFFSSQSG